MKSFFFYLLSFGLGVVVFLLVMLDDAFAFMVSVPATLMACVLTKKIYSVDFVNETKKEEGVVKGRTS